ncbi:MAG: UvrD-helicase domain-containing protein [Luteolibacter sp.]
MARIIPSKPRGKPDKAFHAFYRVLKTLPDDFTAWLSLDDQAGERPHVFLVWRECHAFLIQVASTSQQLAETALQAEFFEQSEALKPEDLGRLESDLLEKFVSRSSSLLGPLAGALPLKRLVIFPNVSEGTVDEVMLLRSEDSETSYLGLHQIQSVRFARRLEALASAALPEPGLFHLRRAYTPESEVPEGFVARASMGRNTAAELPACFLDFDQEWCVKNDLDLLSRHGPILGETPASVRLVTGVAGSGKSLVLLYRALLSAKLHPEASVLVLTHNRPLRFELERRSKQLAGMPRNLSCRTFFQWADHCLGRIEGARWAPARIERCLARLKDGMPVLVNLSPTFLADEVGWIKDQRLLRKELYLEADRSGRGTSLRGSQREEMWNIFHAYQHALRAEGATDWHNIALRFHEAAVVEKTLRFPCYDAVFIDEAQFFAKTWFETVSAALKPGGHLFLAADPTQGFLRRRQSWIAAGVDVRGRSTKLTQAYRNTRAILSFAREFYESRRDVDESEGDLNVPDDAQLAAISETGEAPVEIYVPSAQEEIARATNEVCALREAGLQAGKLLVLHADSSLEVALRKSLAMRLGEESVHDAKSGPLPPQAFCSVTTLAAATGLEAPVVILLGMDRLLESEKDTRLAEGERGDLRRDHTRMLYMGFTRAGQRLIILRSGSSPPAIARSLLPAESSFHPQENPITLPRKLSPPHQGDPVH